MTGAAPTQPLLTAGYRPEAHRCTGSERGPADAVAGPGQDDHHGGTRRQRLAVAARALPLPRRHQGTHGLRLEWQRLRSGGAVSPGSLVKLVPTDWGPPTFEIDGIKMLPTAKVSPFEDARRKVALIQPRGKRVLDCCGGLGYFAHWCLNDMAAEVHLLREERQRAVAARHQSLVAARQSAPATAARRHRRADRNAARRNPATPSCMIRHASALRANCTRRPSTTSWRA